MATFAETMLSKYETLLQTSAGLDTVSVDGQSVRYTDVEAKYRHWKREVAREKGTRPQSLVRRPAIRRLTKPAARATVPAACPAHPPVKEAICARGRPERLR